MGCEAGAGSGEVSYLFFNVNGAGVRHGGCMAGETRRHMVKVGAKAAQRTCTQPSQRGDHQGLGGLAACEQVCNEDGEPPAGTVQGDHHAWCPPQGFAPRRTKGWACLWCRESWVPARHLCGCTFPVQAAPSSWGWVTGKAQHLPACGLSPATQMSRGYVVPLGGGNP